AVISSYLVANDETWPRGILLSFASAILQAFTAVAVVGIAAALLGATAKAMGNTVRVIEIVSYALIMLIGLRLLWVKGRAFLRLLRGEQQSKHARGQEHHHHTITTTPTITTTRTATMTVTTRITRTVATVIMATRILTTMTMRMMHQPGVTRTRQSHKN